MSIKPELCPNCGVSLPEAKINMCSQVVDTIRRRPDLTYEQIADSFHVCSRTVKRYARRANVRRYKRLT